MDESPTLIADTREQAVLQYAAELGRHTTLQMTIGDYAIVGHGGVMLAIIERKSLSDAAASLKDGRWANREKLYQLREQTGCAVIFIIEGSIVRNGVTDPNIDCGGCRYGQIESSLMHMMIRDRVSVLWTQSARDTALTLARLVKSMSTLQPKQDAAAVGAAELLQQKIEVPDDVVVQRMFAVLRGVSESLAAQLLQRYSLADFVCRRVTDEAVEAIKVTSPKTGKQHKLPITARRSLTVIAPEIERKLLAAVPGVSKVMAGELLKGINLAQLLGRGPAELADSLVYGRRLGPARAETILKYFNWKKPAAAI